MITVQRGGNLFSGCFCKLAAIIDYFNKNKKLPEYVNTQNLWYQYKSNQNTDLNFIFFKDNNDSIEFKYEINISSTQLEPQFSDYKKINYIQLDPFIKKYFLLSDTIMNKVSYLENKYKFNYDNLCGVMFRGNDKCTETNIPPYSEFINRAKNIYMQNPSIQFLVQTDEKEFLDCFISEFPNTIYIHEIPVMNKRKDTCLPFILPKDILFESTLFFIATIKILSKAKELILTSGNGELWIALYRGNANGIHQYLNPLNSNETKFWQ